MKWRPVIAALVLILLGFGVVLRARLEADEQRQHATPKAGPSAETGARVEAQQALEEMQCGPPYLHRRSTQAQLSPGIRGDPSKRNNAPLRIVTPNDLRSWGWRFLDRQLHRHMPIEQLRSSRTGPGSGVPP